MMPRTATEVVMPFRRVVVAVRSVMGCPFVGSPESPCADLLAPMNPLGEIWVQVWVQDGGDRVRQAVHISGSADVWTGREVAQRSVGSSDPEESVGSSDLERSVGSSDFVSPIATIVTHRCAAHGVLIADSRLACIPMRVFGQLRGAFFST